MQPIEHIRKNVFQVSQEAFGEIAGVNQGTVSRWEAGELEPSLGEMALIRAAARKRSFDWNDSWFFSNPAKLRSGAAA